MNLFRMQPSFKGFSASLIALATVSLATVSSAQTQIYNEPFTPGDYTTPAAGTYSDGQTLSDQNGWTTNDHYTGGYYTAPGGYPYGVIGQSDGVDSISNVSTSSSDYVGYLGGYEGYGSPGTTSVTLNQSLPGASGATTNLTYSSDFLVGAPATTGNTAHDNFGIALTTGIPVANPVTGSVTVTPAISIGFILSTTNPTATNDNITYSTATGTTTSAFAITLSARYKLTISVNIMMHTYSAFYQGENTDGTLIPYDPVTGTGGQATIVSNASYTAAGGITGYDVNWQLQNTTGTLANNLGSAGLNNTAYTNRGSNALFFDNVLVTVPEPSIYAMIALGALGLGVAVRRSRVAKQA